MFKYKHIALASLVAIFFAFAACKPEPIVEPEPEPEVPKAPELRINVQPLEVGIKGKTYIFDLYCNREVAVESSADWCTYSLMHDVSVNPYGSLKIVVEANKTIEVRTAEVTVSAEECEPVVITVTQDHRTLSSDKELKSLSLKKAKNSGLAKDVTFSFDSKTNTFSAKYLKWIEGSNPEMLVPEFDMEGVSVMVNGQEVESGKTALSFAEDFTVSIAAEDGSVIEYKVTFNCPQINTELPVLHMKPEIGRAHV